SFTASAEVRLKPDTTTVRSVRLQADRGGVQADRPAPASARQGESAEEESTGKELALMVVSVLIAALGIAAAWKFYVVSPQISERLATDFSGAHRLLLNKY